MGPVNIQWYKDRGLVERAISTLTEDSQLTGRKAGESIEYDKITIEYAAGRIDCHGDGLDRYGEELYLPPMMAEDWGRFSEWLDTVETDDLWTLEQLVEQYEKTNPKIRWAE